ncbi:MAG TPA: O-antigen ligase family protein [Terriglobales bacterium]
MRAALRVEPDVSGGTNRGATSTILDQITFYGLFGLLGFAPLAFGAVQPWAIFILESATAALFVLWLVTQARLGEIRISESPLFVPMAVFAALIALQILAGRPAYRYQTIHQAMLYWGYGLLCFLVMQCLRKTSQVNFLAYAATIYGFGLAVFAIFQSVSSAGQLYWLVTPSSGGWIYGPYVNHNHYAGLMEMLVPVPMVAGLTHLLHKKQKMLALGAAAIMASTIFLSGSRGGMIAFIVQMTILGVFLIKRKKSRTLALALAGFLVALIGLTVWLGGSELGNRVISIRSEGSTEISGGTRMAIVRDSWKMWTARPLMGWGLGNFPEIYPQYRSFYTNLFVNQAHNDYVQLMVEMGAIGFALMLWFLATTFYRASTKLGSWPSNINGALTLSAMLGIIGILVHSLTDFNLQIPANAALFYVLCTLCAMEPRFPLLHHRSSFRRHSDNAGLSA